MWGGGLGSLFTSSHECTSVLGISSCNFTPNCKEESGLALPLGHAQELVWVCFCVNMKNDASYPGCWRVGGCGAVGLFWANMFLLDLKKILVADTVGEEK